jgi:hypothetical protein
MQKFNCYTIQKFNCYTMQKCRRKPSGDQQVLQKPHNLFKNMIVDTVFIVVIG